MIFSAGSDGKGARLKHAHGFKINLENHSRDSLHRKHAHGPHVGSCDRSACGVMQQ